MQNQNGERCFYAVTYKKNKQNNTNLIRSKSKVVIAIINLILKRVPKQLHLFISIFPLSNEGKKNHS